MTSAPVRVRADELAGALRTEVSRLAYHLRTPAARSGITPTRLAALVALERQDGQRQGDLAGRLGISPASTTRLVDLLVESGWASREQDPTDHRAQLLSLTEHGRQTLASLRVESTSRLQAGIDALTADQQRALAQALPVLRELADRHLDLDDTIGRAHG